MASKRIRLSQMSLTHTLDSVGGVGGGFPDIIEQINAAFDVYVPTYGRTGLIEIKRVFWIEENIVSIEVL
jgi:hypothetical protein